MKTPAPLSQPDEPGHASLPPARQAAQDRLAAVLKQAELGMPVADLIRKIGKSEQTFCRWKKQYASLDPEQARKRWRWRRGQSSPYIASSAASIAAAVASGFSIGKR